MTERIQRETFFKYQSALPQSLMELGRAAEDSGLGISLIELIKLRASQINGCAFCLNMHAMDARKHGEKQDRLDMLAAWREAPCFSARERAALAWTESLTLITDGHVPDDVYQQVRAEFSEEELANLTAVVIAINGWNRIAVALRFTPMLDTM